MLFNSIEFLFFLPAVTIIFWTCCRTLRAQNLLLLCSSYLFYGWWDVRFLFLILMVTAVSYLSGRALRRYDHSILRRRSVLWTTVVFSLGILFLFKYFDFFSESFAALLRSIGMDADAVTLKLVLPVGISFYIFQSLSYTIDVYRRSIEPTRDTLAFFVFISFFPQLVAGPIERAADILPQFTRRREFDYGKAVEGMRLILWGLFKKMVVADNAAPVVNAIFSDFTGVGTLNLWIGAVLFSLQIYCDFSGYSDIAIGSARLFNVNLMRNFDKPYFSRSITEFWKKWHISLTSWFRDYVYIPLGGNRRGRGRTAANTFAVFLTSGLWHGANFTFIAWGLYHAVLFMPSLVTGEKKPKEAVTGPRKLPPFSESIMMAVTFLLAAIGWVIFRAENLEDAFSYIALMFTPESTARIMGKTALAWSSVLILTELLTRRQPTPFDIPARGLWSRRGFRQAVYAIVFLATLFFAGSQEEFIYFRF